MIDDPLSIAYVSPEFEQGLQVPVRNDEGKCKLVSVPCWRVTHPKFDGVQFAIHKSVDFNNEWKVVEFSTGMVISAGHSQQEAINAFNSRLAIVSVDQMQQGITKGRETRAAELDEAQAA